MNIKKTENRPLLGQRITAARKQQGFSQVELAGLMSVTQQTINIWESSRANLRSDTLIKLAKALNASVDSLLGLKEPKESSPKNVRLWRKLLRVEQLAEKDKKIITETIDALIARQNISHS